jgi:hypothetical protein
MTVLCCTGRFAQREILIPTRHTFMIKQISEDKDGELWLLGTFVQSQFGSDEGFEFRTCVLYLFVCSEGVSDWGERVCGGGAWGV